MKKEYIVIIILSVLLLASVFIISRTTKKCPPCPTINYEKVSKERDSLIKVIAFIEWENDRILQEGKEKDDVYISIIEGLKDEKNKINYVFNDSVRAAWIREYESERGIH